MYLDSYTAKVKKTKRGLAQHFIGKCFIKSLSWPKTMQDKIPCCLNNAVKQANPGAYRN